METVYVTVIRGLQLVTYKLILLVNKLLFIVNK